MPRWAHNPETHECEAFIYGGCGGNDNRFASEEQCEQACMHEEQDPEEPGAIDIQAVENQISKS